MAAAPPDVLLSFGDERAAARRVARAAGVDAAVMARHRFPDGELKITLPASLPRHVAILRSLHDPNVKLVELLLVAGAARELGARRLTLIAPYLAYMRQDRAFAPGESVSQHHVCTLLDALFDRVITVDPHLHRVASLADVLTEAEAVTLTAAPAIGTYLGRQARGALLMGPDEESAQWVEGAARAGGLAWAVARKTRHGDRRVTITLPEVDVRGRRVVLVDDMISTGRTLVEAARRLGRAGATRVDVAATHALFTDGAAEALRAAGVQAVWTTDSVPHPTNAIRLGPVLAAALGARP